MKWLSKLFKSGTGRGGGGGGGRHPQILGEESMVMRAPSRSLVNNTPSFSYCSPFYLSSLVEDIGLNVLGNFIFFIGEINIWYC